MLSGFHRDASTWPPKPVIIITGGNSGVGYGIAHRLIKQLGNPDATDIVDAFPEQVPLSAEDSKARSPFSTPNGLTLVLACRNAIKAHRACSNLLKLAGKKRPEDYRDQQMWKAERTRRAMAQSFDSDDDGSAPESSKAAASRPRYLTRLEYRQHWLDGLRVEFVPMDLASVISVFGTVSAIQQRYPYVTHLYLNAGCGPFIGLNWGAAFYALATDYIDSVTYPKYPIEKTGEMTKDGLGWTWQCNVFGHYLLARGLLDHLNKAPLPDSRIIWTGSLDGLPEFYDPKTYQAIEGGKAYQSTKFQIGLLAWAFNALIKAEARGHPVRTRSYLCHPGVVAGNMFYDLLGWFLDLGMRMAFYLARWLGSPYHCISEYKAGMAFVFVGLAPLFLLHTQQDRAQRLARRHLTRSSNGNVQISAKGDQPVDAQEVDWLPTRFSARCSRGGNEYVGIDVVLPSAEDPSRPKKWWWDESLATDLLETCEKHRRQFINAK
ncbi:uncharacterized protein L969DRAFT_15318 [Mixia osmundae IAM 14324]|uniref:3-keto sterol reductase n=1 Tax=Mixia osmundae (strain CBS 9802 / IAM 14324 / JCM 22182 / KY 12970) TaxID=764103 RepID=G7DXT7_MIXOS|nr:uncharacterized protein L969DRAFT_15318 [Mixia osmundae IAM 14324]KEI41300.1 hypothetical protein L969DRAFT_15318 [Mixia osmundae IAM 14324]GAA95397.1 hypothetical protein E5Q_02051 [Mixia osmundae IAM 14324]